MAGRKHKKTKSHKNKVASWYSNPQNLLLLAGVILLTFIAFSPVFQAQFVNWDDMLNVYENKNVINFDIAGIFSDHVIGNYNPLSILSLAIDYSIVGESPGWYHKHNLLLHVFNIILVFSLMYRLGFGTAGSIVIAALFALHPMRVESVAWITERKDVLYTFFYLGGLHTYISASKNVGKMSLYLILTFLLFILSALSKIQAVTFPLSLILIDYWMNKDGNWWKWSIRKIPYFLISLVVGITGIYFLGEQGSLMVTQSNVDYSILDKLIVGFNGLGNYLIKAVVPYEMVTIYPYPQIVDAPEYLGAALGVAFLVLCVYLIIKPRGIWTFGCLFFLVNIMFMLQFVDAGQGYKADRFTYLPYLGLFSIAGYYMQRYFSSTSLNRYRQGIVNLQKPGSTVMISIAVLIILTFSFLTYTQTQVWKNSETLWKHQIQYYALPLPLTNLANYLRDQGRQDEAMAYYNNAIKLKPDRASTYNSRGKLLFSQGRYSLALKDYQAAVKNEPDNSEYYSNRGAAYANLGQLNRALKDFNKAVELDPVRYQNYLNRALVHTNLGMPQKSYQDFKTYSNANPNESDVFYEMANLSLKLNQPSRALQEVNHALNLNANRGIYYRLRAEIYIALGRNQAAQADINRAQQLGVKIPAELRRSALQQ